MMGIIVLLLLLLIMDKVWTGAEGEWGSTFHVEPGKDVELWTERSYGKNIVCVAEW